LVNISKNPLLTGRAVLRAEAEAVRQAAELLDENFSDCVTALLACRGRLVVTGVGKSALIGQKIVATLNSTGTPALFMHAADAIHGDLGMIQPDDMVLAISRSGTTAEVKVLVPLLRRVGVKLIALVSDAGSYLATHADFVLHAYAPREADPLNLAPTTSTTVALAVGDALAVSLLEARGFTHHDFARYHPGGALGKRLYLKISDIYPHHSRPTVPMTANVRQVILAISAGRLGATAVINDAGHLAGIVTDGDIRRMLNQHGDHFLHLSATDILTPTPVCVQPDDYAVEALQLMQAKNISQVIVTDNQQVLGFVHLHDLLREGLV
jgi:arabinose-5-phosphate isomerase